MRVVAALFGASALEVIHWYDLREHLTQKKVAVLLHSPGYWVLTGLMIMFGAVGALLLGDNLNTGQIVLFAAAFPTLFKKLVVSFKPATVHLGEDEAGIGDYFR